MSDTGQIDYEALAKKYGAVSSTPSASVDYSALAKKYGATSSTPSQVTIRPDLQKNAAMNASPTQFEYERDPANHVGFGGHFADTVSGLLKPQAQNPYPGMGVDQKVQAAQDAAQQDQERKNLGRSATYRAVAAIAPAVGVNVQGMEHAADVGDAKGVLGAAAGSAAPVVVGEVAKNLPKVAETTSRAASAVSDVAGRVGDTISKVGEGPQGKVMSSASNLPRVAVSGLEDIFRAAAPTSKNAGFRDNLYMAAPDLADIARKIDTAEAKGGIINPDMRVRATVDAIGNHLQEMYQTERAPQIQRHGDTPVEVGADSNSRRGLEYLESTAGDVADSQLARKALDQKQLTLAEADRLARIANESLKSYERAPSDVQLQLRAINPKIGALKALDQDLLGTMNDTLKGFNEPGLSSYEHRYAALSEVRNQLRDRMNATELKQEGAFGFAGRITRPAVKLFTEGPSGVPSASQAATADVNIGRSLQTGLKKLKASQISAKPVSSVGSTQE